MIRFALALTIIGLPVAAALAQSDDDPPRWMANIARKQHVVMYGIPSPYGAMRDPTPDTAAKLRRGRTVFDRQCASCHGWSGQGTGPEAFALVPAPADLAWLVEVLGVGPTVILSRGYGNCRITATALANTWWVQYFNSADTLILNTIEVTDLPDVAPAAADDFADSIERLAEWTAALCEA